MSVTFHLYEIDRDVKCLGSPYSRSTKEQRDNMDSMKIDEVHQFCKREFVKNGEEVDGWDIVDVSYLNSLSKIYHRCKRYKKYVQKLRTLSTSRYNTFYGSMEVLPVKQVLYRQGWFVNKKFLNKQCTWYFATTRKELEHFFDLYLDVKGKDERGLEAKEVFLNAWQDGMLFEAAY